MTSQSVYWSHLEVIFKENVVMEYPFKLSTPLAAERINRKLFWFKVVINRSPAKYHIGADFCIYSEADNEEEQ